MIELVPEPAEMAMVIEVTRSETGLVEIFNLAGTVIGYEKTNTDEES